MSDKKNILFVSISSDMYGSSKVLLSLVRQMQRSPEVYHPIVCMPYEAGPLKEILRAEGVEMIEMPVVKLTRSLLKSFKFLRLAKEYFKAKKIVKRATKDRKIDIVQSNTLATLFGAFYCMFRSPKHVMHVHEIMDRPRIATVFFKNVLRFGCSKVVYNSEATRDFYNGLAGSLRKKSVTIVNGVEGYETPISETERRAVRERLFQAEPSDYLIGLVGRINRLKGHSLMLKAFEKVATRYPEARLCLVGSPPPGQEEFLTNLEKEINDNAMADKVTIVDFQDQIFPVLESLDLVTVPSTEPESFGLIVVEAMLARRAVIGSNIGGIGTIITHQDNGLLFAPGDAVALESGIVHLMEHPEQKEAMEERAFQNAVQQYSTGAMYEKFHQLYKEIAYGTMDL
ncbi:MAG: glycosyltransferase family 4 protein [Bacteroidota bacterium]